MACLSANVSVISERLKASASMVGENLKATSTIISEKLKASCSIVCTIAELMDYLEVTPIEVQWITDDVGVFFDVKSNVQWIVTTD